jgi:anti-sigma regulatory factor (Ser/Thr protein kinase)
LPHIGAGGRRVEPRRTAVVSTFASGGRSQTLEQSVPSIDLAFSPVDDKITLVRRFVEQFSEKIIGDEDAAARIAMTAHELLENAAKYSTDGVARLTIHVEHRADRDDVQVILINHGRAEAIQELKAIFDEMSKFTSSFSFYQSLMTRTGKRRAGSGLGLGRIMVEGEMRLSLELRNEEVVIRAQTELLKEAAA